MSAAALLAAVLFGAVWSITEDECLPGGNLFGITSLFICALIGGKLVALIRLPGLPPFPPLLGKAEDLVATVCALHFVFVFFNEKHNTLFFLSQLLPFTFLFKAVFMATHVTVGLTD